MTEQPPLLIFAVCGMYADGPRIEAIVIEQKIIPDGYDCYDLRIEINNWDYYFLHNIPRNAHQDEQVIERIGMELAHWRFPDALSHHARLTEWDVEGQAR